MTILPKCISVNPKHAYWPWRPKGHVRSLETGIKDGFELLYCAKNQILLSWLYRQCSVLLTTGMSL